MDKQEQQETKFTIVSLDESFFFYDSLVRRVWIDGNNRPIVRVTGSHKHSCIFGAISMEGNHQLFRQYTKFNGETFLNFLKKIHAKFPRCYLFMDKASSPHYKSKKVRQYFEENRDTLIPIYLRLGHNSSFIFFYLELHVSKSLAYILSILDLFSQFYSYSIPLTDRARPIIIQLQIQYEIHVRAMDLS